MRRSLLILSFIFLVTSGLSVSFAQQNKPANSTSYKVESDLFYYENDTIEFNEYMKERCRLDIYFPENIVNFPTVVWFHGGGLRGGNRFIPDALKNQNIAIVAVNYRLYPEVSNPTYIEDAAAAVAWVFKHIQEYGGSTNLIFIAGHSAGGYLTSMIGLDKKWLARHEIDANRIAGLIPFSGHTITHFTVREERGMAGEQPIIDEFAPLYHVRSDAPPLVLITGDRNLELLGRYEENAYMMRMMKIAGHKNTFLYELQGFDHGEMVHLAYSILLKHLSMVLKNSGEIHP